jgi:hypothetical protein
MKASGPRDLAEVYRLKRSAGGSLWKTHQEPPPQSRMQFLRNNWIPWIEHYLGVMFHKRHPFNQYHTGNGIFTMPDSVTVALAADWGTGTRPAYKVAKLIGDRETAVTIHMGDVYFSGTPQEYRDWFLGTEDWPRGSQHTFAMNANHEMYSGGEGYFETALGALNQEASYFCLENSHWRILGLDSGYYSGIVPLIEKFWHSRIRLHDDITQWLRSVVFPNAVDPRPVIVLTHHQLFSAFDSSYSTLGKNLAPYLDRVLLWFWGHEHRFAGYGPVSVNGLPAIRARCIGHGGMPIELDQPDEARARATNLVFYDDRRDPESSAALQTPIGYCGFAVLRLDGPLLTVEYIDENGNLLLTESWNRSAGIPVGRADAGVQPLHVVHRNGLGGLVHPR